MKFQLGFLLVGLVAAAELPTLQLADEDGVKRPAGKGGASVEAFCPPSFPRYCSIGGRVLRAVTMDTATAKGRAEGGSTQRM
ncbi:hypothetical protein E4U49_001211 [Claviceps purpurea]|nr:hypothetical protein E4U49_001211 [Claviceps purpurea]